MSSSSEPGPSGSIKFKDTHLRSLEQIFSEYVINSVPYYQRNYSWQSVTSDSRPVAKLWSDFITKYNDWLLTQNIADAEYMLGAMVFVKQVPIGVYEKFEIIDGQQRLSTVTMLICIVRDILIEQNFATIKDDMNSWPSNLDKFVKRVELIEELPITSSTSVRRSIHKHWKLKMNRVDEDVFKQLIQEYLSNPSHKFSEPGKDYMKISQKIKYIQEQLKSKDPIPAFQDSQKLLLEAYVYLYTQVQDRLVVGLRNTPEANEELDELEIKSKNIARKNIEADPVAFNLPIDFFNNDIEGYNVLDSTTKWSAVEYVEEFDKLFTRWSQTKRGKGKTKEDFITFKISTYLKKLKSILEDESNKVHDTLCSEARKNNIPQLFQFINNVVMEKMFVTRAEVKEDKDAFQIFDTMNSAGTDLSKSNLIKNLVIKHVNESEQGEIAKKWDDQIIEKIGLSNADTFILQSLRSRGLEDPNIPGKYIFDKYHVLEHDKITVPSGKNLYDVIRWLIETACFPGRSKQESKSIMAKQFIDNLVEDALIFEYLENGDTSHTSANPLISLDACIHDMNYLGAKYIRIAMYTAYREWKKNSPEFILLVKFLVPFFFKYKTISDNNASKLESNMITVCEIIKNGDPSKKQYSLFKIIKFLLSTYDDNGFANDFEKTKNDDKTNKYILHRINTFLEDKYTDVEAVDGLQLEHILPQKPKNALVVGGGWEQGKFFANYNPATDEPKWPSQFNTNWVNLLGNMTLLHYKTNKTIGNSNFQKKLLWKNEDDEEVGYTKSQLPINVLTVVKDENQNTRTEWTANSLIERTNSLNDMALKVWKLPEIFCDNPDCYGAKNPVKISGTKQEIFERKCIETRDKMKIERCDPCGHELIVKWHKPAPEYRVPTVYTIDG